MIGMEKQRLVMNGADLQEKARISKETHILVSKNND